MRSLGELGLFTLMNVSCAIATRSTGECSKERKGAQWQSITSGKSQVSRCAGPQRERALKGPAQQPPGNCSVK